MPDKKPVPATDSARDLQDLVGDDATAEFESDPKFADADPTSSASSENLAMRDTDDEEDSDDELEDEDEDDEDDEEYEDSDEDEESDEEDDEDEYEDDDDEEEDDEDDDELSASHYYRLVLNRAA